MKTHIDFETRSEVSLPDCGADRYARDRATELHCMAWALDDAEPEIWTPGEPLPAELAEALAEGALIHAHNAAFERAVWAHICVPRFGWPDMPRNRWRCSMARCLALALPAGLDAVAKALGLPFEKDAAGHRLMMRMSKPLPITQQKAGKWAESPEQLEALYSYCKQDVRVERAVLEAVGNMDSIQVAEWLLDQRINDYGVPVDLETIDAAMAMDEKMKAKYDEEIRTLTHGAVERGTMRQKMLDWLISRGLNIGDLQAETVTYFLGDDLEGKPRVPNYRDHRVLELRKLRSLSSNAKYAAMKRMAGFDGRVRGVHQYHAASTGRYGGRGVQFQNVPRGGLKPPGVEEAIETINGGYTDLFYDDVPKTLSNCLRAMVQATPGHRLIVCDFSGIEARVLAWLAGEIPLLKSFRRGDDVYKMLASKIYKVPVDEIDKDQRFIGKTAVLGLGYQMGADRFSETVEKYGRDIEPDFAQDVVDTFRSTNPKIVFLWNVLDRLTRNVINDKRCVEDWSKLVEIKRSGSYLRMRLPSGRSLSYYHPKIAIRDGRHSISYMGINSYTNTWERLTSYGGKITENLVQAISRDLLVSAMFRLQTAGYRIIFHVHDEVVIEAPNGFGSLEEVSEIMCRSPRWGKEIPVGAAGYEAMRYRKD